ncbi:uncharacterized protein C8Q71DRAFT_813365, partial [Rhodofomes roseus]
MLLHVPVCAIYSDEYILSSPPLLASLDPLNPQLRLLFLCRRRTKTFSLANVISADSQCIRAPLLKTIPVGSCAREFASLAESLGGIALGQSVCNPLYRDGSSGMTAPEGSPQDAPAPRLPTEVCGRIIDHLAAGLDLFFRNTSTNANPHLLSLQSCALVCRDWYFYTWYHLRRRVHFRDRNDVRSLSRTLRERPRLRGVVEHVIISGHTSDQRSLIQHLGTFAATFAGKLPKFSLMTIEDAEWTVGSIRMEDIGYLATFHLVHTLYIVNVTVPSIAQLARLISALPGLTDLVC